MTIIDQNLGNTYGKILKFTNMTLIPTIGTGLIILFSSPQTLVGRFLGTKILVSIGLISYGVYLWHQPLFAFARHISPTEPNDSLFVILAIISFLLAYLSWKYVERPFRKKEGISRRAVFIFAVVGSITFIVIGMVGIKTGGFNSRTTINGITLQSIEEQLKVNHGLSKVCEGEFTLSPDCRTSDQPEIIIWGDSFAMHLVPGILASNPDAKVIQMTKSVCGPFFDVAPISKPTYTVSWAEGCLEFSGKVREWLKANDTVKYAVVSSPFARYLDNDNDLLFRNGDIIGANSDLIAKEFVRTLDELEEMGIIPIVFSPPPANGVDIGRCLARVSSIGLNLDACNFQTDTISKERIDVYSFLETLEGNHKIIRLDNLICDNSLCETHFGSTFIYRDSGHLSSVGSAELGEISDFYGLIVED